MKKIFNDLWQTKTENPAKGLYTHAYLLIRDDGNVLFYNTGFTEEIDKMDELGGVNYQLLSHQDELGDSLKLIKQRFGSKLGGPKEEQKPSKNILLPIFYTNKKKAFLVISISFQRLAIRQEALVF